MPPITNKKATQLLSIFWMATSLLLLLFFLRPSEPQSRTFWLYSPSRLGIIILATLLLGLSILFNRKTRRLDELKLATKTGWRELFAFGGLLLFFASQSAQSVVRLLSNNKAFAYFNGYTLYAQIFALYFSLLGIALAVYTLILKRENFRAFVQNEAKTLKTAFWLWTLFTALYLISKILYQNANQFYYTSGPHAPVLEWQIFLAWLAGIWVMKQQNLMGWIADNQIALVIWALTVILWRSQALNPGYGTQPPIAPNYAVYPFSDAQLYDQNSQSIIIGKGMANEEFPARPIYVVFLALTHALVGQDYNSVIAFQTLFLAAFPAVLYLLGKELGGRPLGVAVALLAIFRDITANAVAPFVVSLTYSKVLLSELPVALLLSLFTLLAIRWIKYHPQKNAAPLVAGGVIGVAMLIRTQSIIAIVPAILIAWIMQRENFKRVFIQAVMMVLGIALVISPWLVRNWQHTGGIVLDNPLSQMNVLAERYSQYPNMEIPRLPSENDSAYSNRMLKIALDSAKEDPKRILMTAGNQFAQNVFGGVLVFPLRDSLPGVRDIVAPTTNFWESWRVDSPRSPLYFFYALLLAIGVAAAWQKEKWLALLPLGINLLYNLWTALFFASGIRFVFPVDWVFYLYQMLGLLTLTRFIFLGLGAKLVAAAPSPSPRALPRWGYAIIIGVLFLSGLSLPLSEVVVPDQYPAKTQAQMWAEFHAKTETEVDERLILLEGRALYPRYFAAGEGIAWTAKPGYEPSPQSRIVFEMAGQTTGRVIFPLADMPAYFPHTVDVTLLTEDGTPNTAQYILVDAGSKTILYERSDE